MLQGGDGPVGGGLLQAAENPGGGGAGAEGAGDAPGGRGWAGAEGAGGADVRPAGSASWAVASESPWAAIVREVQMGETNGRPS